MARAPAPSGTNFYLIATMKLVRSKTLNRCYKIALASEDDRLRGGLKIQKVEKDHALSDTHSFIKRVHITKYIPHFQNALGQVFFHVFIYLPHAAKHSPFLILHPIHLGDEERFRLSNFSNRI